MSIPAHQAEQIMAVLAREYNENPAFRAAVDAKSNPVLCSWCHATITPGDPTLPTSHGICDLCLPALSEAPGPAYSLSGPGAVEV